MLATWFHHRRILVTHVRLCLGRHVFQRRRGSSGDPRIGKNVPPQSKNKIAEKNVIPRETQRNSETIRFHDSTQIQKHLDVTRDPTQLRTNLHVANTSAPPKSRDRMWKHREAIRDSKRANTKTQNRTTGSVAKISLTQIGMSYSRVPSNNVRHHLWNMMQL